jgi:predicted nucleic acid-binding protein
LIVFDASTVTSAALKMDSVPEHALLRAEEADVFALSSAVEREIVEVLNRAKFARVIPPERRRQILEILRVEAVWFKPTAASLTVAIKRTTNTSSLLWRLARRSS